MSELTTSVLIVGGGTGGVAAALAVARTGGSCIITEPTDWVGGQLTSQAVPPDENRWIERDATGFAGGTDSYGQFRELVRAWYRANRKLTAAARDNPHLNPGNGWVSRLCMEPRVAHDVLQSMLAPHVAAGRVKLLLRTEPVSAELDGDLVRSVTVRNLDTNETNTITAKYFIDATELGDLLPLAQVEYAQGAEHRDVHGELHGRTDKSEPNDIQAFSWCFAVEHRPGENHTIEKPASYDFWSRYVPAFDVKWPGRLFSWTIAGTENHEPKEFAFIPWPDQPREDVLEMWRYRRIVDRNLYESGANHPDVCLVNWVQMDYFQTSIIDVSAEQKRVALKESREQSLSLVYWLQQQFPGLKLRGDELGTSDGFAKHPYIRESRRLKARTIVTEAHIGTDQRKRDKRPNQHVKPWGLAEAFADSVGIGHYRLDLHPSCDMKIGFYVQSAPFRIPLGALIPVRVKNVLAGGKNLGVTHITNGCYRMHPVEWNVGEAAGLLAQHCIAGARSPAQVHEKIEYVREFQQLVKAQGIPMAWPWEQGAGLT